MTLNYGEIRGKKTGLTRGGEAFLSCILDLLYHSRVRCRAPDATKATDLDVEGAAVEFERTILLHIGKINLRRKPLKVKI
jgi:hypothetical protein